MLHKFEIWGPLIIENTRKALGRRNPLLAELHIYLIDAGLNIGERVCEQRYQNDSGFAF